MHAQRHPMELLVRNLSLRAGLNEADRQVLLDLPFTLRTLEPGSYAVREADTPDMCGVLVSGFAYRQKLTGSGDRQIVAVLLPGDAVDLQTLFVDVADHSAQMLTRAEMAFINRPAFQSLVRERPGIAHAVLVKILVEASVFREWVLNVGRRDARTRAAHLLCELAVLLEAQGLATEYGYELPMTQEQLGDALGLTPVHVNRTLKSLEADGLITRSKRVVGFPDWKRMREVGDFNSRYLHLGLQNRPEAAPQIGRAPVPA